MCAFQIKNISNFIILRLSTHSDGKLIEGQEALSTALLDFRHGNRYAENGFMPLYK